MHESAFPRDAEFNVHEAYHHQGLSQYGNLVLLPTETRDPRGSLRVIKRCSKRLQKIAKSLTGKGFSPCHTCLPIVADGTKRDLQESFSD
ncbi:hypothetical protein EFP19_26365 [Burkholderia glumae]|nr:hypothetical protein EFP19_26365 [Burkholderia glumae]